ncbi:MAG: hypothetical protein ACXWUB_03465, partial [Burkholderiales bacterium]
MSVLPVVIAAISCAWVLAYHRAPAVVWTLATGAGLALLTWTETWPPAATATLWVIFGLGALLLNPTPVRR